MKKKKKTCYLKKNKIYNFFLFYFKVKMKIIQLVTISIYLKYILYILLIDN